MADQPRLMEFLHNLEIGYNRKFALSFLADEVWEALEAAVALYERVEMDESVGICLSDRVDSLRLGAALNPVRT
jgi:hypothetical protein